MTELTTPNKTSRNICCTPIDRCILSPFLPQDNQFYTCMSPMPPVQVSYISPARSLAPRSSPSTICDCLSVTILQKKAELLLSSEVKEEVCEKREVVVEKNKEGNKKVGAESAQLLRHVRYTRKAKDENKNEGKEDRIVRKRKRKNMDQLKLLYNEYKANSNWTKAIMAEMALKTGLTEAQVYKWSWDQKKKIKD
eukprot:TRINITY_DN892_c0_g4_i3.p1 TRINITY_DN892_c0_g4~~TRINITY_DN892_c0_g4_i3.p1  ORF type:complete len:195 (-),score=39.85 TRINITY_DN892_c0_g4_i3:160-744(-)